MYSAFTSPKRNTSGKHAKPLTNDITQKSKNIVRMLQQIHYEAKRKAKKETLRDDKSHPKGDFPGYVFSACCLEREC